jgi:hypothetical protein
VPRGATPRAGSMQRRHSPGASAGWRTESLNPTRLWPGGETSGGVPDCALVGVMGAMMTDSEATVDLPVSTGDGRQPVFKVQADARARRDSILHAMTPAVSAVFTQRRPVLDSLRVAAMGLMLAK